MTLPKNISNSFNHINEKLVLWLDVEYHSFVNDIKEILGFMILKEKGYFLDVSSKEMFVYTLLKITFFGCLEEK